MAHEYPSSVDICRQQLDAYSRHSHRPLDLFTAHDQYGLVLMKHAHDPQKAGEQFSQAIELAPQGFKSSDAEWAYVYWHRAAAEQQRGNNADAEKDFGVAENSLREVEDAMGKENNAAYYHDFLSSVVKQHLAMLESENQHDQAKQVLANFAQ
jgi:tetratricopeptide (TPR) repeat protein